MKILKLFIILGLLLSNKMSYAQTVLKGMVMEKTKAGLGPLPGASVYWLKSFKATISDSKGWFLLPADSLPAKLVVSYIGYKSDTILIQSLSQIQIVLKPTVDLKEVEVAVKRESVAISTVNPLNSETITARELLKAACCNLSEAFETNPTVTVAYRDAVTGAKEIRMLGLAGIYSQLLTENIPNMRGLAGIYGLTYIPGPWMESIQVTKGSGSVLNGYESTTGQINIEFLKPHEKETKKYYLNLFTDNFGGHEINTYFKKGFGKWSGIMMAHGRYMNDNVDRNKDNFLDMPHNRQLNLYNRWQYDSGEKIEAQVGVKFLIDDVKGGEFKQGAANHHPLYHTNVNTKRAEVFGKLGFVYPEKPFKSIGNIFQLTYHDMDSKFGLRTYNANEKTLYIQSIYQNTFAQTNHQYKVGFSYRYDELNQQFQPLPDRIVENLPGVFAEYTYNHLDKFTAVVGVREDLRNGTEWIFTPRLHAKYNFTENLIVRGSVGRSYRQPFVIADHISALVTSRAIEFRGPFEAERAWNYGFNFTSRFKWQGREGSFLFDIYRTHFINQLIVDTYTDSSKIVFSNLVGTSYSNSVQVTLNYELMPRLETRFAYKVEDVKSMFNGKLARQPLIARDRALVNLAYATEYSHWKFDWTAVWEGKKQLQNVYNDVSVPQYSPDFFQLNAQVTKEFRRFDVYAGVENLLDFRQQNPILHPEDPFGSSFDATNVWGPIAGRRIYAGLRFSIR